jgi:DegV family protein with EDD domain
MSNVIAKQPVKIVTDSTSDLPPEWAKRWDIAIIPAFVVFGEQSYPDDGVAMTRAEFYRRLAESKVLPGTAAPPPQIAEDAFRAQLEKADHVVAFTVAKQFSSLYNSIRLAAEHVAPERITVIDSGTVSLAMGWQALAAAEVAARGGSLEEVIAAAQSIRERHKLVAAIDSLENLRRGGRITLLQANVGTLLQIKPILTVREGVPETLGRVRTLSKAIQTVAELARAEAPLERIAILHSNFLEGAQRLKEQLADILPTEPIDNIVFSDVTTAIGTHIGPGCVGTITVRKKPQ